MVGWLDGWLVVRGGWMVVRGGWMIGWLLEVVGLSVCCGPGADSPAVGVGYIP